MGRLGRTLAVPLVLAACSGDERASQPGAGSRPSPDPTAGSYVEPEPFPPPHCVPDESCTCRTGDEGTTSCASGVEECVCECPAFEPDVVVEDACAGEPFGDWILESVESDGTAPLQFISSDGSVRGSCPTQQTSVLESPEFLMRLADGGFAAIHAANLGGDQRFGLECLSSMLSRVEECDDFEPPGGNYCAGENCGLCSCPSFWSTTGDDLAWSRTAGTLRLEAWLSGGLGYLDYCVTGDTMRLQAWWGLFFTVRRVAFGGRPSACELRDLGQCEGAGCTIGRCVGDPSCEDARLEAACTNQIGCAWDVTLCGGEAEIECAIGDYGKVPGCGIFSPNAVCGGTPRPCADYPNDWCDGVEGCSLRSSSGSVACAGTPTSCGTHSVADCELNAGCVVTGG